MSSEKRTPPRMVIEAARSPTNVAECWRSRYQQSDGSWRPTAIGSSEEIYRRLRALGARPGIRQVADVIGNRSWSYLHCTGCGTYVTHAVRICTAYSDDGPLLCRDCAQDAADIFPPTTPKRGH